MASSMFGYRVKYVERFIFNIAAVHLRLILSSLFSQQLKMFYRGTKLKRNVTFLSTKFTRMAFYSRSKTKIVLFYIKKKQKSFKGENKSLYFSY